MYRFILLLLAGSLVAISLTTASGPTRTAQAQAASETRLAPNDPAAAARFGSAAALSSDRAVVGAPGADGAASGSGAAYVFRYDGTAWRQEGKLTASDGQEFDLFGRSVAIAGELIVVGANGNDEAGGNAGAAYVFGFNGTSWEERAKLTPDATGDTFFGWSVATTGEIIVVGAPYRDSGTTNSGAAYVFRNDGGSWVVEQRLSSEAPGGAVLSDLFGWSVAATSERVVVGAHLDEAAYVYRKGDTGWSEEQRLSSSDGLASGRFGWSVAIGGGRIVVGAVQNGEAGLNAGAAYVFDYDGANWAESAKLLPPSGNGSRFGWSVALEGDSALVGARESAGPNDREESGAVYLFRSGDAGWGDRTEISASDAAPLDHFGEAVALSDGRALVGAPDAGADSAGAAYLYEFGAGPGPGPGPAPEPPLPPPPVGDGCVAIPEADASAEEVVPGAGLRWSSAFRCENAAAEGEYSFTVTVSRSDSGGGAVTIEQLALTHTTPRPRGEAPGATFEAEGLPLTLAPGETKEFTVRGTYELASTDEGDKANLHFCAAGLDEATGEPFRLGINALLRGPGASDAGEDRQPPQIADVRVSSRADGVTITWQTDEPARGTVRYAAGTALSGGRRAMAGCAAAEEHRVDLNGLDSGASYAYRIHATDGAGNEATSGLSSFKTLEFGDKQIRLASVFQ